MSRFRAIGSSSPGTLCAAVAVALLTACIVPTQKSTWQRQASDRIQAIRQRDTHVRVLDEQGQPIPGVNVEVKQTGKCVSFRRSTQPNGLE
jgi:outer membrane biogenesis lipoprotein LolB